MKVLNLFAGIGGNRKLWEDVEVTAVEIDPDIAALYSEYFPNDTVIVGDAHEYLLDHYNEFDFIWSSPPCTTHSRMNLNFKNAHIKARYPDMKLYQEIIFLDKMYEGKYCVENVIPYYQIENNSPLIPAQRYNRHLFWCNFKIPQTSKANPPKQTMPIVARKTKRKRKTYDGEIVNVKPSQPRYGFDLKNVKATNSRKDAMLRNAVDPEIGQMILNRARGIITKQYNQTDLFA